MIVSIHLNSLFYTKDAILQATKEFSPILSINLQNDNYDLTLEYDENSPNLPYEFCNYVLGLMKEKGTI